MLPTPRMIGRDMAGAVVLCAVGGWFKEKKGRERRGRGDKR